MREDVIILRRAGQKTRPSSFCESERVGGIFASDAVARLAAQRNGHWFRQGGRKFQGGGPVNLKTSSIRPIRATTQRYIRRHRQVSRAGIVLWWVRCKGRAVSQ